MYTNGQYHPNFLKNIKETCNTTPIPTLTNKTTQQGDYLPRKTPKMETTHSNLPPDKENNKNKML